MEIKQCGICKIEKSTNDNFYSNSRSKDGFAYQCRECDQNRKEKLKLWLQNTRKNSKCTNCGYKDHWECLEFAHIDRETKYIGKRSKKRRAISQLMSISAMEKELKKCKILCARCHRIETHDENQKQQSQTSCGRHNRRVAGERREFVNAEKLRRGKCMDCGFEVKTDNTFLFDFDHLDASRKMEGVASMVVNRSTYSIEDIRVEMTKCDMRCVNCHILITRHRKKMKV
jgi:hypothetical protein